MLFKDKSCYADVYSSLETTTVNQQSTSSKIIYFEEDITPKVIRDNSHAYVNSGECHQAIWYECMVLIRPLISHAIQLCMGYSDKIKVKQVKQIFFVKSIIKIFPN